VTNYQALPDDETFLNRAAYAWGPRDDPFGMTEKDFETLPATG
jgi:hypothetical protein